MNKERYTKLLFVIASIFPILILTTHFEMCKYPFLLFLVCVISTILMVYKYEKMQVLSKYLLAFAFVYFVLNYQGFLYGLGNIYNDVIEVYARDSSLHFFEVIIRNKTLLEFNSFLIMLLVHVGVSHVLYILFQKKKHVLIIAFLLLATFPVWIVRISFYWVIMIPFIGFLFLLLIPVRICEDTISFKNGLKQSVLIFITTCVLLVSTMTIMTPQKANQWILDNPFFSQINDYFTDLIDEWLKEIGVLERIELKEYKDRIYNYLRKVHGEVITEKNDTYYLKELNGSVYEDSAWKALDAKTYKMFDDVNLQKVLRKEVLNTDVKEETFEFVLKDYRVDHSYSLFPYNFANVDVEYSNVKDRLIKYEENKATFMIQDNLEYTTFKKASNYRGFVYDYYLQIPEDMVAYFEENFALKQYKDLIKKDYASKKEEVIAIVFDILDECKYTLKPGETPMDKDFVQYFLSENKKGYSPHFATAATLLLRYFEIPARYVQGYRVQSEAFKQKGTTFSTNIYDKDEYAWVEIYDEEIGWYPLDVSVGENIDAVKDKVKPIVPDKDTSDQVSEDTTQNNTQTPVVLNPNIQTEDIEELETKDMSIVYIVCGICLLPFVLVWLRRYMRKQYYKKQSIQNVCYALYRRLEKMESYKDVFDPEMVALFEKNKFSLQGIDEKELEILLKYTEAKSKEVFKNISLCKKLKFYFIDCLM